MAKSVPLETAAPHLETSEVSIPLQESPPSPPIEIEKILQKARVGKKLSLREVAKTLCLTESTVQAIEEEKWEAISHEKTYVLGFITAYGKLLQVPTADILERYKASKQEKPPQSQENWAAENEQKLQKLPSKGILWICCGVCLLIVFFLTPYFRFLPEIDLSDELSQSQPLLSRKKPAPIASTTSSSTSAADSSLIPVMKPFSQLPEVSSPDNHPIKEQLFGSPRGLLQQVSPEDRNESVTD